MNELLKTTPQKDGFRMPGEFESHSQCWIIWPEREDNWREGSKPAQKAFVEVAIAISEFESVTMVASPEQYANARSILPENIRVVEIASDDAWMRDCGPTFVKNDDTKEIRVVDWRFNAWGGLVNGLYTPWDNDDKMAGKISEIEKTKCYRLDDFILEGGSIHVDGEGTCIVTEECLLDKGRNPQLTKQQIENNLKNYLNVEKVIWIPNGIYLDETNGHVDNILHYIAPAKVVLAWTEDRDDPQFKPSQDAYEILSKTTDSKGRKLKIVKLHTPHPVKITKEEANGVLSVDGTLPRNEGDRQAASYCNFYMANNAVILPVFNDEKYDKLAIETLEKEMPDRKVVPIYAREILLGGGNIHCITQQQPV